MNSQKTTGKAFGGLTLFLTYLKVERGVSTNTLDAYRSDIRQLIAFYTKTIPDFSGKNWDWAEIGPNNIKDYIFSLNQNHYSLSTKARKIASTNSLFKFLYDENEIHTDPCEHISIPKMSRMLPSTLSESEINALFDSIKGANPDDLRDKAMFELMYASGIRVSELISCDTDSIDLDQNSIRVIGKGAKERMLPIHSVATKLVAEYMTHGRSARLDGSSGKALFLNKNEFLTKQIR